MHRKHFTVFLYIHLVCKRLPHASEGENIAEKPGRRGSYSVAPGY